MIKNCEQCGKEFKVTTKKKKYCSLECYKKSRKKYIIGKKFGKLTVIKKIEKEYKDEECILSKKNNLDKYIIRGNNYLNNVSMCRVLKELYGEEEFERLAFTGIYEEMIPSELLEQYKTAERIRYFSRQGFEVDPSQIDISEESRKTL